MIDKFCVPVFLYGLEPGLEALENKSYSIKAIDFVYNSVFVKLFINPTSDNDEYIHHLVKSTIRDPAINY